MCCTRLAENTGRKKSPENRHLGTIAQLTLSGYIFASKAPIDNRKKVVKQQYVLHMSPQYDELPPTRGWDRSGSLGDPCKFQRLSRHSWQRYCTAVKYSERQPNFAALNRTHHLCSAGRPSRWALAHIIVNVFLRAYLLHYANDSVRYSILHSRQPRLVQSACCELTSPRVGNPRVGVSASCPVTVLITFGTGTYYVPTSCSSATVWSTLISSKANCFHSVSQWREGRRTMRDDQRKIQRLFLLARVYRQKCAYFRRDFLSKIQKLEAFGQLLKLKMRGRAQR